MGSHPDSFAFTKAIHKATRNAIKQLLSVPVIREVLSFYLKRQVDMPDPKQQDKSTPNDKISSAQKAAFAFASNLSDPL